MGVGQKTQLVEFGAIRTLEDKLAQAERDVEEWREKVAKAEHELETAKSNVEFWKDDLAKVIARRDDFAAALERLRHG